MLDASALLAVLREEPGSERVEPLLDRAAISVVNVAEVLSKLIERGMPEMVAWSSIAGLGLIMVDLDPSQARALASLRPLTRPAGLSLGDRACIALALQMGRPALTAERSWARLDLGIEVRLIR